MRVVVANPDAIPAVLAQPYPAEAQFVPYYRQEGFLMPEPDPPDLLAAHSQGLAAFWREHSDDAVEAVPLTGPTTHVEYDDDGRVCAVRTIWPTGDEAA